jgi:hypothetical protein
MAAHKLTVGQINAAIAAKRKQELGDGHGLVLRVAASGSAQWIGRYTVKNGKRVEMGHGGYPTVDLKAAREKSADARRLALDGKPPTVERDKRRLDEMRAGKSFAEIAEEFIALREIEWKHGPRQTAHWRSQLARYAYPLLGKLPVAAIDTGLVLGTLEPIWKSKTGLPRCCGGASSRCWPTRRIRATAAPITSTRRSGSDISNSRSPTRSASVQ